MIILNREHSQVAIVAHIFYFCDIRPRVLITPHDDLTSPAHNMGIGHDSFSFDYEPGTAHAPNRVKAPGRIPDRLLAKGEDLDYGSFRIGGLAQGEPGGGQQNRRSLL